jgi:hypothetical protein
MKKNIFPLLALCFLILCPALIFYSQGYRFSLKERKVKKVGGIYFKTIPKEAKVYLNSKYFGKTSFLTGSLFLQNLFPAEYKILVEKENFFPWEKNLRVDEGKVVFVDSLVLFPKNIDFKVFEEKVSDFFISRDGKKMVLEKENSLEILDLENNKREKILDLKNGEKILKVNFSKNDEISILLQTEKKKKEIVFRLAEKKFFEKEVEKESFQVNGKFWIDDEKNLWLEKEGQKTKIFENVKDLEISPDKKKMAICTNNEIWILNLKDDFEKIFLARFSKKISNISWLLNSYLIFGLEDSVKIIETDWREKINIYPIAKFETKKVFFNQKDKKIYILCGEKILSSEKLFD